MAISFLVANGVQAASASLHASTTAEGILVYDDTAKKLKVCDGDNWIEVGTGSGSDTLASLSCDPGEVPEWDGSNWICGTGSGGGASMNGAVMAFNASTCPDGWTEYLPARGRFLRGIDNGAGNDPDGTRAPGSAQADKVGPHTHDTTGNRIVTTSGGIGLNAGADRYWNGNYPVTATTLLSGGDVETRPKNVAVIFCQYNGTGGLSGGSGSGDVFGDWDESSYGFGSTYQAPTDGIVIVQVTGTATTVRGYTDSNANPTTAVGVLRVFDPGGSNVSHVDTLVFPVKKDDYWKTDYNGTAPSATDVLWIPLVGGGGGSDTLSTLSCDPGEVPEWDGSAWICGTGSGGSLTGSTMVSGWPDAIKCNVTNPNWGPVIFYAELMPFSTNLYYYRNHTNGTNQDVIFTAAGVHSAYSTISATSDCGPGTTIADLYSAGKAFNFVGGGSAEAAGDGGQIQFNDGSDALAADAALHWDNTNKRLGIGTATPGTVLDVTGVAASDTLRLRGVPGDPPTGGSGLWTTDGTHVWRSTGNVGIGKDNPFFLLELAHATTADGSNGIVVRNTADDASHNTFGGSFLLLNHNPASGVTDTNKVVGSVVFQAKAADSSYNVGYMRGVVTDDNGDGNRDNAVGALDFLTKPAGSNNATRHVMRLTGAGNVGIGTTTPNRELEVAGRLFLSGDGTNLSRLTLASSLASPASNLVWNIDASGGAMRFFHEPDIDTAGTVRMTILSNGNVGIGTSSPVSKLHVVGSDWISSAITQRRGAFDWNHLVSASGAYILRYGDITVANDHFTVLNSGNVGIGTTSPQAILHVAKDEAAEVSAFISNANGSGYPAVRLGPSDRVTNGDALIFSGSATGIRSGNRPLVFQTGSANSERMRITSDGNLGIGITNPATKLDVWGGHIRIGGHTNPRLYLSSSSASVSPRVMDVSGTDWRFYRELGPEGTLIQMTLSASGYLTTAGGGVWSDLRLKKDVAPLPDTRGLESLMALRPVVYKWRDEERGTHQNIGLIAQEVESVIPEVVRTSETGEHIKSVDYSALTVPLIRAVQELKAENDRLRDELKARDDALQARIDELEAKLK
jgi:hypothetical protein